MTTGRLFRPAVPTLRIVRFGPTRPFFAPGAHASVSVTVDAARSHVVQFHLELTRLNVVVAERRGILRLPNGRSVRHLPIALPDDPRRGYGLRIALASANGSTAHADASVEALAGWWESPRHAALTRFVDPAVNQAAMERLVDWHVTVVQAYDWMYRHYRYRPPARAGRIPDRFVDALGRSVSHAAVRSGIRAGHRAGIATLAYGSVYGAEPEYVARHPAERVFDDNGQPISLGGMFFINDIRPGGAWRRRLLREYAGAVRSLGFDGVHMDTYGPPHRAMAADGGAVDFAAEYPGLIAAGAASVAAARPGTRVLFNCVEGFPIDAVARAPMAALYLELWPPDERYSDLLVWVERARRVAAGRAVVIAAYLSCLRTWAADPVRRPGAVEAVILLTTILAVAGAYHHVLAEDERILVEGYYPEAQQLRRREAAELRSAWAFHARMVDLVSDPGAEPLGIEGIALVDAIGEPIPTAAVPTAGAVWVHAIRTGTGRRVVHLVDLLDQPDDRWDAIRATVRPRAGWSLDWPTQEALVAASPWTRGGRTARLRPTGPSGRAGTGPARVSGPSPENRRLLPRFRRWLLVAEPN